MLIIAIYTKLFIGSPELLKSVLTFSFFFTFVSKLLNFV